MKLSEGSYLVISLRGRMKVSGSLDAFLTLSRLILKKFDVNYVEDQRNFQEFMIKVRWSMSLGEVYDFSDRIQALRDVMVRYLDAYVVNYNTRFIQSGG